MTLSDLSGFMSYKIRCTMVYMIDGGSLVRGGQLNVHCKSTIQLEMCKGGFISLQIPSLNNIFKYYSIMFQSIQED